MGLPSSGSFCPGQLAQDTPLPPPQTGLWSHPCWELFLRMCARQIPGQLAAWEKGSWLCDCPLEQCTSGYMNILSIKVNFILLGARLRNRLSYLGNTFLDLMNAYTKDRKEIESHIWRSVTTERCVWCTALTMGRE